MKQISEREAKGLEGEDVQTSSSQQAASRLPARVARTAGFGLQAAGFRVDCEGRPLGRPFFLGTES